MHIYILYSLSFIAFIFIVFILIYMLIYFFIFSTNIVPNIGEYKEKDELYDPFEHRDKRNATS